MTRWLRSIYTPATVWQVVINIVGATAALHLWGWGAAWLVLGTSVVAGLFLDKQKPRRGR